MNRQRPTVVLVMAILNFVFGGLGLFGVVCGGLALLVLVRAFIEEDIAACEAIQAASGSPVFAVGPLARDHEAPIGAFHPDLLRRLA